MVIKYDNKQIYKKIPDHLMINLKLNEGRMWKKSDGLFIVQYNRDKEKQQFKYQLEEHKDMLSGTIKKCEVLFPMPKIELKIEEVARALEKLKRESNHHQID